MRRLGIDSELLTLFVVGETDPRFIPSHRRLWGYTRTDYELLREIASAFDAIAATPHVLAETSNLISYVGEPMASTLRGKLAEIILYVQECAVPSRDAAERPEFTFVGLTDAAWLCAQSQVDRLIAVDGGLLACAMATGLEVIDFRFEKEAARRM